MRSAAAVAIREERGSDAAGIRRVNEAAFGRRAEADLVDRLRREGAASLSLVAVDGEEVVGHALFSPVGLSGSGVVEGAFGLGPMAVLPELQRDGIGSRLVREGLRLGRERGFRVVAVLGHADYYPRFGFAPAQTFRVACEFPVPAENFMLLELAVGASSEIRGTVEYHRAFREA